MNFYIKKNLFLKRKLVQKLHRQMIKFERKYLEIINCNLRPLNILKLCNFFLLKN